MLVAFFYFPVCWSRMTCCLGYLPVCGDEYKQAVWILVDLLGAADKVKLLYKNMKKTSVSEAAFLGGD